MKIIHKDLFITQDSNNNIKPQLSNTKSIKHIYINKIISMIKQYTKPSTKPTQNNA